VAAKAVVGQPALPVELDFTVLDPALPSLTNETAAVTLLRLSMNHSMQVRL
jgi:hypothetical protein